MASTAEVEAGWGEPAGASKWQALHALPVEAPSCNVQPAHTRWLQDEGPAGVRRRHLLWRLLPAKAAALHQGGPTADSDMKVSHRLTSGTGGQWHPPFEPRPSEPPFPDDKPALLCLRCPQLSGIVSEALGVDPEAWGADEAVGEGTPVVDAGSVRPGGCLWPTLRHAPVQPGALPANRGSWPQPCAMQAASTLPPCTSPWSRTGTQQSASGRMCRSCATWACRCR